MDFFTEERVKLRYFSELFQNQKTKEGNVVYREFDHQRVHNAPDDGHKVERVPAVLEVTLSRNECVNSVACPRGLRFPYPGSVGDELEDALEGKAHGEREVHVAQNVGEEQRGPVILQESAKIIRGNPRRFRV